MIGLCVELSCAKNFSQSNFLTVYDQQRTKTFFISASKLCKGNKKIFRLDSCEKLIADVLKKNLKVIFAI